MVTKKIFFVALIGLAVGSCNYVDNPNPEVGQTNVSCDSVVHTFPAAPMVRNVLLEDFSGHKCPNCPDGAEEIENLHTTHGNRVIAITIHPHPDHTTMDNLVLENSPGSGKYETVWYINEGGLILASFSEPGYMPIGLVDRTYDPGFGRYWWDYPSWDAQVTTQKAKTLDVTMATSNIRLSNGVVCGKTAVEFLNPVSTTGDYRIVHYLYEDSLVDWQLEHGTDVPNYLHRHVLRAVANNDIGGVALASGSSSVTAGTMDTVSYSFENFTVLDPTQLGVISFIYDSETKEVMQTVSSKVVN